jgi:CheY-like chemotaxis protein
MGGYDDAVAEGKRVLVVNDDAAMARSAAALLAEFGYETRVASDGAIGLDILSEWQADLVLLDLIMPVLDGFGFLEQLPSRALPHRPVVLVWSVAGPDALARAGALGATECLEREKTGPEELLETIERLLIGSAARRQAPNT